MSGTKTPGLPGSDQAHPAAVGVVDPTDLAGRLDAGERIVLLDVRWALGDDHGHEHYLAGHLPGAVFVDLETELSDKPGPGTGRHPLPTAEHLQAAARRWGLRAGDEVVVYDNSGGLAAARAWWLLRWAGHRQVRLLDGGLAAWLEAGLPVRTGEVTAPAGDVVLSPGQLPALDADEAARLARDGVLLDARAGERYRGETEPIDPRAGHIPGARSLPAASLLGAAGRVLPPAELNAALAAVGVTQPEPGENAPAVGVYCGSGVTASFLAAALATVGVEAVLYPGSWSEWSADPARPAATGAQPG
ncbi:sulfurtransferase [Frankia sp. EUN1f]|uniref:sulfurtransferase n=1 Tax=Parafrankia sp. EUN1f TaxID=102897 RepID=UPI0001C44ADE|nr:Rhodanese domain protein [Parafrankia sp. EUN1f]